MKTRYSFVTNSSSSCFITVIRKDAYDREIEKCTPFVKAVLAELNKEDCNVFGVECISISEITTSGSEYPYDDLYIDYEGDDVITDEYDEDTVLYSEALNVFLKSLKEGEYAVFGEHF